MHKRYIDWQERLVRYLANSARLPFCEGQNDCALFLAGAVEAMTGRNYAAPYVGRYTSTRGGLRILRRDGFSDHVALAAHHLEEIPVAFAQEGDGAVVLTDEGPALGVVQGENIYIRLADRLGLAPLLSASRAFRV